MVYRRCFGERYEKWQKYSVTLLNLPSYLQSVAEELLKEPWMLLVSLYF